MGRLACFDYGRARIGISISDERKIIASPLHVLKVPKTLDLLLQEIQKTLSPFFPFDQFIVGLPLLLNGEKGEMALEAQAFGTALANHFPIPCLFWDERLSSTQAEKLMKEASLNRKQRAGLVDTMSSTLVLQNYMDCQAHLLRKSSSP